MVATQAAASAFAISFKAEIYASDLT